MASGKRFRRVRKLYSIDFEDPDLAGFEVIMKGVSLEQFIEATELGALLRQPATRTKGNIERQFTMLAENLVSWNYADEDGHEVPAAYAHCMVSGKPGRPGEWCPDHAKEEPGSCEYEGLCSIDFADVTKIMHGWMQSLASVPKPSSDDSPSGGTSEEQELGLARLSSAPAS